MIVSFVAFLYTYWSLVCRY